MGNGCSCYEVKLKSQGTNEVNISLTHENRKSSVTKETMIDNQGIKAVNITDMERDNDNSNDINNSMNIGGNRASNGINASLNQPSDKPALKSANPFLSTQKKRKNDNVSLQRNSAFLTRTNIHIGVYGYFQSGKKSFAKSILNLPSISPPTNGRDNKVIEIEKKKVIDDKTYDVKFCICPYDFTGSYYKKKIDFYIILYDSTSCESFEYAKEILKTHIKDKITIYNSKTNQNINKSNSFLIGTKIDLCKGDSNRRVNVNEFIKKNKYIHHYEVSSIDNVNTNEVMKKIFQIFDYNTVAVNFGVSVADMK